MIVNKRRIAEMTFRVILMFNMRMIVHRMSVIAMMNVSHIALVTVLRFMRRPCDARHDESAYEHKKGCNPEHG